MIVLEGAQLAEQFRAIAEEEMRFARLVSNTGKPETDNEHGRNAVRLRVAATEIDRLVGKLGECLDLIADAVANHESGGRCDMDLARAAVVLARNEPVVENHETKP